MNEQIKILKYFRNNFTEPIRDPVWKNIYLSPAYSLILSDPQFQRLQEVKQLGPSYILYPGATHTRFNHSLGVFHLAFKIIEIIIQKPECPILTIEGVNAFLCASLLHDLGHFPYAHSLKELSVKDHETLTGELVQKGSLADILKNHIGTDPYLVASIVDDNLETNDREVLFFRKLLSGVLDPDKLDYLNRDAFFCGVPYGLQDIDFVLSQIVPLEDYGLALTEKGISAVENLLFSKYLMYKSVYWHKTVRIPTALIKKALYIGIKDHAIEAKDLYGLTDNEFKLKFTEKIHPIFKLIQLAENRGAYFTAKEISFDEQNPLHKKLTTIESRCRKEKEIAARISKITGKTIPAENVVLDLPSALSFETDLFINPQTTAKYQFNHSDTVFNKIVVDKFTTNIRKFRLILPNTLSDIVLPEDFLE